MDIVELKRIERKIARARETNELGELKNMYMELATFFTQYEKYEDALHAYEEALSISERKGWNSEIAVAQRMIAETYCSLGEYEKAIKYAEFYLNYSQKAKDKIEEQRGHATKGRIYFCWGEYLVNGKAKYKKKIKLLLSKSLSAYEKSLKICEGDLNEVDVKEIQKMKSRLFQNLGLVMGSLGNYKEANSNFEIAIQINKSQNFKENLYWCYLNQGDCFFKAGDCSNACSYFDLAYKASTSSKDSSEALKLKAKAYLKLGKVYEAKSSLREAYKLILGKDPEVVQQLRVTVYLCKLEKMIKSTPETDYKNKKKLYEKKGDAYCALKQYSQGINAYLIMLDLTEKSTSSKDDLLPCYTSLAQTYKDDGQYSSALFYCQKELELIEEYSCEACKTYLFLAELYECLDYDYETIYNTYQKAREIAKKINERGQEVIVLKNIIQLQTDFGYVALAEDNEKLLKNLKNKFGDYSDDESDTDINSENFIFEIDDDELFSDVDDDKPRHLNRRNCFKIKRNKKGETELHVATIRGNITKVKELIAKGHPVNEKDLAGWTVLHEACNHGYVEIANLLLNHGADINNPGGEECEGITPLHDAAENGHFDVIKLLIKRGASTAVVTNRGDTPLDCLKRWRSRTEIEKQDLVTYKNICEALKTSLDSANLKEKRKRLIADLGLNRKPDGLEPSVECINVEGSAGSDFSASSRGRSAAELYKAAIEGVRRRHDTKRIVRAEKKTNPALINEEEIVEDWLEDDMETAEQCPKRRKTISANPVSRSETRSKTTGYEIENIFENMTVADDSAADLERERCGSPVFTNLVKKKRKKSPPVQSNVEQRTAEADCVSFVPVHTTEELLPEVALPVAEKETPQETPGSDLFKFKVQVVEDTFLIPVAKSKVKDLTVQWLVEAVAKRYSELYGLKPNIILMTGDNAIVLGSDPLCVLENEVKARVLDWKKMNLGEKYLQECSKLQWDVVSLGVPKQDVTVASALNTFSTSEDLLLRDLNLEARDVIPVFRILQKEKLNVKVLDLSRNYLGDEGIEPLMEYLETCSFQRLYLLSNGITVKGVQHFAERLNRIPEENLNVINCLDFSFNRLTDDSILFLHKITEKLKNLEYLGTDYCGLSSPFKPFRKKADGSNSYEAAS